jgi:hypothetical protein
MVMQGNVVAASRWLGASMVLSSVILVVGSRWTKSVDADRPRGMVAAPDSDAPPEPMGGGPKVDGDVRPTAGGREICVGLPDSERVPILETVPGDSTASCLDPPSEAEVWAKLPRSDSPVWSEAARSNARFLVEKIGEKVDPCKVYPLAGACELVHCHYKCSVYFDESSRSKDPIPINHRKARVEVVFIDKDHLRRCPETKDAAKAP